MLKSMSIYFLLLVFLACNGNKTEPTAPNAPIEKDLLTDSTYDEKMVLQFGADSFGMKQYVMAFLKKGPNRNQDSSTVEALQKGHMENINKMAASGKLVLAGPFMDDGDMRGVFIFNVSSLEEARRLTEKDPAVVAGRLTMELHPWYGSAALIPVNAIHKKLARKPI
jgi:uncharacterized protein YciI